MKTTLLLYILVPAYLLAVFIAIGTNVPISFMAIASFIAIVGPCIASILWARSHYKKIAGEDFTGVIFTLPQMFGFASLIIASIFIGPLVLVKFAAPVFIVLFCVTVYFLIDTIRKYPTKDKYMEGIEQRRIRSVTKFIEESNSESIEVLGDKISKENKKLKYLSFIYIAVLLITGFSAAFFPIISGITAVMICLLPAFVILSFDKYISNKDVEYSLRNDSSLIN